MGHIPLSSCKRTKLPPIEEILYLKEKTLCGGGGVYSYSDTSP